MTPVFSNREFQHPADGWYDIEPKGEHPNQEAGIVLVIDDTAADSIVNRFNALAAAPSFAGMLVDHEHFKQQLDKETIAYGWLMRLQNRADAICGQMKWTATGQKAVDGGDYRFFSTEYSSADCVILNRGQPERLRPLALSGLTLTNAPRNRGAKPITNRVDAGAPVGGDPEAAARAFSLVVNRIRTEYGCTFSVAWNLARQQQPSAFGGVTAASPRRAAQPTQNRFAAPAVDFPCLASELLLRKARGEQVANGGRFEDQWQRICNRFPRLFRIANREDGWDALADLEPAAHAEYLQAQTNAKAVSAKFLDAAADVRARFPGLSHGDQQRMLAELYPQLQSQYSLEQAASDPRFEAALNTVMVDYPGLGFEGRWEKVKELYPKLFWGFVLNVGSKSESAP